MYPLGAMVYSITGEISELVKLTVNEDVPNVAFKLMVEEFKDKCCTSVTTKFTCQVHRRDAWWQTAFEMQGFHNTGSITTSQGETYDRLTFFR
ncbi:hypothetical protein UFOVP785_104 [uncultured Caudovirales phage]|uniref:Uncharacterized protein n=1 Tax=uncultured Caudovirales phage TaxID=2100421 RepID=A0A6J5NUS1_9CAUD|nr:hypothetical protein UFOVP785_104 [uncultured Caudovirales phage]